MCWGLETYFLTLHPNKCKVTEKLLFMQEQWPTNEYFYSPLSWNMEELSKRYYRIGDVASILNIPTSTLRFWEKEFTIIKPVRNQKNTRLYTPKDIETIKMIHFLVKEKGLKLDAAQAMIRRNRDGVSKQFEVIERLKGIKDQLQTLSHYLGKVKE